MPRLYALATGAIILSLSASMGQGSDRDPNLYFRINGASLIVPASAVLNARVAPADEIVLSFDHAQDIDVPADIATKSAPLSISSIEIRIARYKNDDPAGTCNDLISPWAISLCAEGVTGRFRDLPIAFELRSHTVMSPRFSDQGRARTWPRINSGSITYQVTKPMGDSTSVAISELQGGIFAEWRVHESSDEDPTHRAGVQIQALRTFLWEDVGLFREGS